jgi:GDP-L-fucose synthase
VTLQDRIYVAGHRGLVGSALMRRLTADGYPNLITRTSSELDLRDQAATLRFLRAERPQYVFMAAARVGGIMANSSRPAEFIRDNLAIALNTIDAAHQSGVEKLMFFGSSCVYPRLAPQPMKEEYLLSGALEPTNRPYAVAKIAGIELCAAFHRQFGDRFFSVMPTNLYGPNDNFDLQSSHVLPALIRKFHQARITRASSVSVWGTGAPRREFLHVDDLASAAVFLMPRLEGGELINIGAGEDISIRELAEMIAEIVEYNGTIEWDTSKPDGTPRKLLDVSRLHALGWRSSIRLREGIRAVYDWYLRQNLAMSV